MQVSDLCHLSALGKSEHDIIVFNSHAYIDFAKPKDRYIYAMTTGETNFAVRIGVKSLLNQGVRKVLKSYGAYSKKITQKKHFSGKNVHLLMNAP